MTAAETRQSFLDFFKEKQHSIVPSAPLLPSSPNLLFTNAGMNQFVPYFLGTERPPYSPARAADTQKCIRAGGKHNDLDDVGLDTYHHTFFEMLGNWSFGDYFKKEAIAWAWELVVGRWGFPPGRLYATIYQPGPGDPSERDTEAFDEWAGWFRSVGLDPAVHIVNGNKKDNFWMMGDTGPCGPCSELHVDLTPAGDTRGSLVNAGDARCMEIWNLVFIQFNAEPDGSFRPLPARHVDTGMGFERVCSILQGTKGFTDFSGTISNYDTDVFAPVFRKIEDLSGKRYTRTLPGQAAGGSQAVDTSGHAGGGDGTGSADAVAVDVAFRVVGDHIRTLCFSIADGIQPSNTDRGYVLRRILRRAVRYGRTLGLGGKEAPSFLAELADSVLYAFGPVFPELIKNRERIRTTLATEEASFSRTIDKGIELFESALATLSGARKSLSFLGIEKQSLATNGVLSGQLAFKLYDTYGFPLDLTEIMARERGYLVDTKTFEKELKKQRALAQAAQTREIVAAEGNETEGDAQTAFVGYETDLCHAHVLALRTGEKGETFAAVDRSPFYAEMGGQVGDTGTLTLEDDGRAVPVTNTVKRGGVYLLKLGGEQPAGQFEISNPKSVILTLDAPRRRAIEAHHTATHLLHWALHEVVGPDAAQKGSYVGPDRLRFDFNSAALTPAQLVDIERLVNEHTIANEPVSWQEVPHAEVRGRTDVMQFFGDKYGDLVRVVQIGGRPGALDGYSMELCAGTHVRATGQLGLFKILSEGAIAAGIRRIEAVAGRATLEFLGRRESEQANRLRELEAKVLELNKTLEKERAAGLKREAGALAVELLAKVDAGAAVPRIVEKVSLGESGSAELLPALAEALKGRGFKGVAVLAGTYSGGSGENVPLLVASTPEFAGRFPAGKLLGQLAPIIGGKGGGRPDLARGAGREAGKVEEMLGKARELVL